MRKIKEMYRRVLVWLLIGSLRDLSPHAKAVGRTERDEFIDDMIEEWCRLGRLEYFSENKIATFELETWEIELIKEIGLTKRRRWIDEVVREKE